MEMLDVVDADGEPTGEVVERTIAHAQGIRHRTAHVWVMRPGADGPEVLLQKRSDVKDSNPGCYDISSAGHIPAGSGYVESALRELFRRSLELRHPLKNCTTVENAVFSGKKAFMESVLTDNQVSRIFYMIRDVDTKTLVLQKSEVTSVLWMSLSECKRRVRENSIKHCIFMEELEMLPETLMPEAGAWTLTD